MELIFHKSEKYIEEDIFYYISDQRDKHSMIKPKKEDLISMTVESENLSSPKKKQISNVLYPFKKNSIDKIYNSDIKTNRCMDSGYVEGSKSVSDVIKAIELNK